MIRFEGGPAHGLTLLLCRAPIYLRVVVDPQCQWDALDQLGDRPRADEAVYAYRLVGDVGNVHVQRQDPKTRRRTGGWYKVATYAPCDPQPTEAVMRDTDQWCDWTHAAFLADREEE